MLLTTRPLTGHVQPLRPLAAAAASRGHEVAFATGEPVVSRLREARAAGLRRGPRLRDASGVRPARPGGGGARSGGAPGGVLRRAVRRHRARAAPRRPGARDRGVAARRRAAGGGRAGRADRRHAGRHPVRHGGVRRAAAAPPARGGRSRGRSALAGARARATTARRAVPAPLRRPVPALAPAPRRRGGRAAAGPADAARGRPRCRAGVADRAAAAADGLRQLRHGLEPPARPLPGRHRRRFAVSR